jgi:hypothetical protein
MQAPWQSLPIHDMYVLTNMRHQVREGLYAINVAQVQAIFPASQVLVLNKDDMIANPLSVSFELHALECSRLSCDWFRCCDDSSSSMACVSAITQPVASLVNETSTRKCAQAFFCATWIEFCRVRYGDNMRFGRHRKEALTERLAAELKSLYRPYNQRLERDNGWQLQW